MSITTGELSDPRQYSADARAEKARSWFDRQEVTYCGLDIGPNSRSETIVEGKRDYENVVRGEIDGYAGLDNTISWARSTLGA